MARAVRERSDLGRARFSDLACPVGDVPGFASTSPARDRESAAYSGDAGETYWIDLSATSPSGAEPPAKGRTRAAGPAVIGARLPLRGEGGT